MLVIYHCIIFGGMHDPVFMLRRRINTIKHHLFISDIHHIVLCSKMIICSEFINYLPFILRCSSRLAKPQNLENILDCFFSVFFDCFDCLKANLKFFFKFSLKDGFML